MPTVLSMGDSPVVPPDSTAKVGAVLISFSERKAGDRQAAGAVVGARIAEVVIRPVEAV